MNPRFQPVDRSGTAKPEAEAKLEAGAAPTAPARHGLGRFLWAQRWHLLLLVSALVALSFAYDRLRYGPEVAVYPAVRADLVKTVVATGHVETPFRVEIGSQITGIVADVLADEGDVVTRGQPLVSLEQSELKAALVQAEAAVAQGEARLRQIREVTLPAAEQNLKLAQANRLNAEAAFTRAEQLSKSGFTPRSTLDEAIRALDVASAQMRAAELQVYTNGPGGSDMVLAETQLRQAVASRATAEARLAYATVAAPRDGVLITRRVERGAVVQPGRVMFVLSPVGDAQIVLQIDERNIGLLRLGQSALVSADAYPDRTFPAEVAFINPAVDIARAAVEVKLAVPKPPAELRQDMTVSVDIEVDRRAAVVVVPARTVHEPNSAAPFVLKAVGGRALRQPVRLGLRAGDEAEVLDGVAPGDLLVPVAAGVRAGQRLKAVGS
jgi:HlyD family secretion protein